MTGTGSQDTALAPQAEGEPISYHDVFGKKPPPRELYENAVGTLEDFKAQPISVPAPPPASEVPYTDANVRNGLNGWQDAVNEHARDSHGQPFVNSAINHSLEAQAQIDEQRKKRYRGRHTERVQVPAADAFKIGDPDSGWVEPLTCTRDFDVSRPPFSRLLDAAYDFFDTRGPCLLFNKKDRHYWNSIRWAMGVKAEFPGLHWPGTGPKAQAYSLQSRAKRDATREIMAAYNAGEVGEICPLLKHTERAVRGFLACARREAEAVWEVSGAIRLAEIFAAFLAFVVHHRALPDAFLAPAFQRALALAQSGPRKIRESKAWEARIDQASALNISGFALLCGNYYTRLKGVKAGLAWELPTESEQPEEAKRTEEAEPTTEVDDGGWGPDPNAPKVNQVDEPTPRKAVSHLESVCAPLPVTSIKLWNFIPFDRRRVTAVFPPNAPSDGAPAFTTRYHRFRTVPTPWSEEEGWKGRAPHKAAGDNTLDGNEHVSPGGVPFEQEKDTCPIPAELDVWVDCEGIEDFDPQCVVGMGLRARWAQIGTEDQKWWIFKLKDYVLPSFWRSTPEELALQASDPQPPYGARLPAHLLPKRDEGDARGEKDDKAPRRSDSDKADKRAGVDDKHVMPDASAQPTSKRREGDAAAGAAEDKDSTGSNGDKVSAKAASGNEIAPGKLPAVARAPVPARNAAPPASAPEERGVPNTASAAGAAGAAQPSSSALPLPADEPSPVRASGDLAQGGGDADGEEAGRHAAAMMAQFTSGIRAPRPPAQAPAIKAVVVGKSDPDYFSAPSRAFAAVDAQDDAYDEVAGTGALDEQADEDDLVACVPDDEYESDESDAADQVAAHWERVLRANK